MTQYRTKTTDVFTAADYKIYNIYSWERIQQMDVTTIIFVPHTKRKRVVLSDSFIFMQMF